MALSDDVQQLLVEQCETHRMPGASAAWFYDGEVHYSSYGVTSVDNPVPVDEDTLFGIGSTSKTLTATALMALTEQGKVSLDDRVIKHLPELNLQDEQARETVTVGQLFDHTSGWVGDSLMKPGWGDDALQVAVEELLAGAPQYSAPGELVSYSNAAFSLAGVLVSRLHDSTFEDAVRELVLEPLGMANTLYLVWDIANRRHAAGHIATPDGPIGSPDWPTSRPLGPAGGAFSTARDMMTWARYHLTGQTEGNAPISEESRLLMQQQRSAARSGLKGVGISWLMQDRNGLELIEHGGNLSNLMVSSFSMAPSVPLAVTCMGNSASGSVIGTAVRDLLLETVTSSRALTSTPLDPQPDLAEYAGSYVGGQWDIDVTEKDGGLEYGMRLTNVPEDTPEELRRVFEQQRTRVVFIDSDLVAARDEPGAPVGDFIRDASGSVRYFRTGLRACLRRGA